LITCQPKDFQRLEVENVLHEAVELDAVVIDDRDNVVHLVERSEHRGFPDLPFLDLAIAQNDVHARREPVEFRADRHAEADRQPLAERAGGALESGDKPFVRMALVDRAQLAQSVQLIRRRVPTLRQHRVEHRRGVALGKQEAVAFRPIRFRRVVAHRVEEKRHQDLDGRQRAPGMSRLGGGDHLDDLPARRAADSGQLLNILGFCHIGLNLHCIMWLRFDPWNSRLAAGLK
jgi:hypothetical protein